VPGRVGHRAETAAQARPYGMFFGPGRHGDEMARWAATRPGTMEAGGIAGRCVRPRGGEPTTEAEGATHAAMVGAPGPVVEAVHADAAGAPPPEGRQVAA
jgi:hypothetical protein